MFGLIAGTLTGVTAFGGVTVAGDAARQGDAAVVQAVAVEEAGADLARARAAGMTGALLGPNGGDEHFATALSAAGSAAGDLAAGAQAGSDLGADVTAPAGRLASYAATLGAARADPASAGATLRSGDEAAVTTIAGLDTLADENATASGSAANRATVAIVLPAVFGGLSLVGLLWAAVWLARSSRRVLNLGWSAAALLVAAVAVSGPLAAASLKAGLDGVREPGLRSVELDRLRSTAYTARAGDIAAVLPGATAEERTAAVQSSSAARQGVATALPESSPELSAAWQDYLQAQPLASASAAAAEVDTAREQARGAGQNAFAAFGERLERAAAAQPAPSPPADSGGPGVGRWLLLLGGVGAGALALLGVSRRLQEYR